MLYACLKPIALLLMRWLFGLESRGAEHVPPRGPVLLVANHSSVLDPALVGGSAHRPLSFLAKAELFRVPVFGRVIAALNSHPVRRQGADAGALRMALRMLEQGAALLVFPEGTRGAEGVLRTPKAGVGMLAALSGAAVVPVYISGSGRAWPRGQRFPRRHKVTVTFGPPLSFEADGETSRKERYGDASRAMMAAIGRLKDTVTGAGAPARVPWQTIQAMGGAGVTAQSPTQNP